MPTPFVMQWAHPNTRGRARFAQPLERRTFFGPAGRDRRCLQDKIDFEDRIGPADRRRFSWLLSKDFRAVEERILKWYPGNTVGIDYGAEKERRGRSALAFDLARLREYVAEERVRLVKLNDPFGHPPKMLQCKWLNGRVVWSDELEWIRDFKRARHLRVKSVHERKLKSGLYVAHFGKCDERYCFIDYEMGWLRRYPLRPGSLIIHNGTADQLAGMRALLASGYDPGSAMKSALEKPLPIPLHRRVGQVVGQVKRFMRLFGQARR